MFNSFDARSFTNIKSQEIPKRNTMESSRIQLLTQGIEEPGNPSLYTKYKKMMDEGGRMIFWGEHTNNPISNVKIGSGRISIYIYIYNLLYNRQEEANINL